MQGEVADLTMNLMSAEADAIKDRKQLVLTLVAGIIYSQTPDTNHAVNKALTIYDMVAENLKRREEGGVARVGK